jgi:hypothetical protein
MYVDVKKELCVEGNHIEEVIEDCGDKCHTYVDNDEKCDHFHSSP